MPEIVPLLLAGFGVWLMVLTVLFAAVVRHLGALEATMLGIAGGTRFDLDADGPAVGSDLPAEVAGLLARHEVDPQADAVILFVSTTCGSCLERAAEFSRSPASAGAGLVVLAAGRNQQRAAELREVLAPSAAAFITDPDAHEIVNLLDINSTPFAVRLAAGTVTGKAYVRAGEDIVDLLTAGSGAEPAAERKEPTRA
jgi:hypothetical protein